MQPFPRRVPRAEGKSPMAVSSVAWLAVGTSKHGQWGLCPRAPVARARPSFAEEIFLLCAPEFSIYPDNSRQLNSMLCDYYVYQDSRGWLMTIFFLLSRSFTEDFVKYWRCKGNYIQDACKYAALRTKWFLSCLKKQQMDKASQIVTLVMHRMN